MYDLGNVCLGDRQTDSVKMPRAELAGVFGKSWCVGETSELRSVRMGSSQQGPVG